VIEIHKHTDWLNANRYTVEERERICRELLGEAQYWNIHLYIKHMHDSTKRPWVGLTEEERDAITDKVIGFNSCCGWEDDYAKAIEAKLKEKNT
jgi:uncharacterized protein YciU (UPF0263 family)